MAITKGCLGKVGVGATPDIVAEVREYTLNETVQIEDTPSLGTCTTERTALRSSWSGSLTCYWDPTDNTGQEVLTIGTSVTLTLYLDGNDSGDTYKTGTAIIDSIDVAGSVDGFVARNFTFQGSGALSQATVA